MIEDNLELNQEPQEYGCFVNVTGEKLTPEAEGFMKQEAFSMSLRFSEELAEKIMWDAIKQHKCNEVINE